MDRADDIVHVVVGPEDDGAAVTAALVADARAKGVRTVFLSAQDDTVARVYERVGFAQVGTACIAEAPSS